MLTGINVTIKTINNKIALAIKREDYEEFKKYENLNWDGTVIDNEFYVGFTLNGKQLYVTGSRLPEEQHEGNIIVYVDYAGERKQNGKHFNQLKEIRGLLGINNGTKMVEVENLSKHPIIQKITELEDAKLKAEKEKKELETQLKNQPDAPLLKEKDDAITRLKKQAQDDKNLVGKLQKEKKELEAKNKTTEQPKQSNAARYTAGIGVGLAAGLIAFTALERTVKLEMLVMIGIAVTSALAVGGITYAVLPSTQVDGVEAQEVNENGKSK